MLDDRKEAQQQALRRLLAWADELTMQDFRGAMANWQREYDILMKRKPINPKEMLDIR